MTYTYRWGTFPKPNSEEEYFSQEAKEHSKHNLFRDILPYEEGRVNQSIKCYYNASWVRGQIAAQRPLPDTEKKFHPTGSRFWKTIWHNQIQLIQMLCEDTDSPSLTAGKYKNFTVKIINHHEESFESRHKIITRTIELTYKGKSKIITHFQLTGWHNMGVVPTDVLKHFVLKRIPGTNTLTFSESGVGRAGVVIAVQSAMRKKRIVNLRKLILKMRQTRPRMVETEEQFQLIHNTLNCLINSTAVPPALSSRLVTESHLAQINRRVKWQNGSQEVQ